MLFYTLVFHVESLVPLITLEHLRSDPCLILILFLYFSIWVSNSCLINTLLSEINCLCLVVVIIAKQLGIKVSVFWSF